MKSTKWNRFVLVVLGTILMAYGSPSIRASQSNLSKNELKSLIAGARTPQDHERLAAYYRSQEQLAKNNQAKHEQMLQHYQASPVSHQLTKSPNPEYHCRTLIRFFSKKARQDAKLAANQEMISKGLNNGK